jgi:hypothetical protein
MHGAERTYDWIARVQRSLPLLAAAGLIAWLAGTAFHADVAPLVRDRAQAEIDADAVLRARGVTLGPEWKRFAIPKVPREDDTQWLWHRFVWREAGADAYRSLIGQTLAPPVWDVRYAKFDGDVAERAEEWRVTVNPDGSKRMVRHTLPEARAGAMLDRNAALRLAERELQSSFGVDPAQVRLVAADEKRRPARADWTFTFADPRIDVGKGGEARFLIAVAGDEIAAAGRLVHVPEDWQRTERERESRLGIIKLLLAGCLGLIALSFIVVAVLDWARHHIDRQAMFTAAAFAFVAAMVGIGNRWPRFAMSLNSAEPVLAQVAITVLGWLFAAALLALLVGLIAGSAAWAATRQATFGSALRVAPTLAGIATALVVAGAGALASSVAPKLQPLWPSFDIESAWSPAFAALLDGLQVVLTASVVVFALHWLDRVTHRFTRRRVLAIAVILLFAIGIAVATGRGALPAIAGAISGLVMLGAVFAILRFDCRAAPPFVATGAVLHAIESAAQKATPEAWWHASLTVVGVVLATYLTMRYIERSRLRALQATDAATH